MGLLDTIILKGYSSISIIGMAKNAGKTVALNYLIESAYSYGVTLGMTSIGRDGEKVDVVIKTDKPTIYVYRGTIIATAKSLIEQATARLEILQTTDIHTAMGKIIIAKVKYDGYIQLAGPSTTVAVTRVIEILKKYGATMTLVDGALDRKSLASPSVTDATLLATGAVVHRDIKTVVKETQHRVNLFNLTELEDELNLLAHEIATLNKVGYITLHHNIYKSVVSPLKTALGSGGHIATEIDDTTQCIVISGVLSEHILEAYFAVKGHFNSVIWVVQDATRIFISPKMWRVYKKRGLIIKVMKKINLVGITYNPISPYGYSFDTEQFQSELQHAMPSLAIINVMSEDVQWNF